MPGLVPAMTGQCHRATSSERRAAAGDLKKLRTGRAHPSLIENLKVEFYGSDTPLNQVANIAIEDARTIVVTPWDKTMVGAIEKAVYKSDLGLTPMSAGKAFKARAASRSL